MPEYSIDELIITCMARELNGEVLVSSVTAFGALAAHVAKSTHAPDLAVLSTPESVSIMIATTVRRLATSGEYPSTPSAARTASCGLVGVADACRHRARRTQAGTPRA